MVMLAVDGGWGHALWEPWFAAQPLPAAGIRLPASLQLVSPPGEELLLAAARRVEAAA
jgi:hypothetical protein